MYMVRICRINPGVSLQKYRKNDMMRHKCNGLEGRKQEGVYSVMNC